MVKLSFKNFIRNIKAFTQQNMHWLLGGAAVVGIASTSVLSVNAGRKHERTLALDPTIQTAEDEFKKTWKFYIAPIVSGIATSAAVIGSLVISDKNAAALAGLYAAAQNAIANQQKKIEADVGAEQYAQYREQASIANMQATPLPVEGDGGYGIINTGTGNDLFFEEFTGRYLYTCKSAVEAAKNNTNQELVGGVYVSCGTFYDYLNFPVSTVGNMLGWRSDDGLIDIVYSYGPAPDGRPCTIMTFRKLPTVNYDHYAW